MAPRQLRVLAVDEDEAHANYMGCLLPQLNFQVTVYTNSRSALSFLTNHAKSIDFVLVAVRMERMSGFQFLDIVRNMHRNIQVILMSTETTWNLMETAVAHGARFLAKKPLNNTICNVWQHLDLSVADTRERIQYLFQGTTQGQSVVQSDTTCSYGCQNATKVESMNSCTSELQESTGSNATTPKTKDDEILEACSKVDKAFDGSQSPKN